MPNPSYTAIQLLLDRSGSMVSIRSDAEGGIRTFIEDQRKAPGKCTLRLAQFDYEYQLVHPSTPIAEVPFPALHPRGGTALLDAWGRAMTEFGEELAALSGDERPAHVVFVVVTDGYENSSEEWNREQIFAKVTEQTETYGWQFLYLAAGQDAVKEGAAYGVAMASTMDWAASSTGTQAAYSAAAMTEDSPRRSASRPGSRPMPTCPTCRHVHAGPDRSFICIGCPCPHTETCDCSHCETRAILLDPEAMAAIEEGLRARGGTIGLAQARVENTTPWRSGCGLTTMSDLSCS